MVHKVLSCHSNQPAGVTRIHRFGFAERQEVCVYALEKIYVNVVG